MDLEEYGTLREKSIGMISSANCMDGWSTVGIANRNF